MIKQDISQTKRNILKDWSNENTLLVRLKKLKVLDIFLQYSIAFNIKMVFQCYRLRGKNQTEENLASEKCTYQDVFEAEVCFKIRFIWKIYFSRIWW